MEVFKTATHFGAHVINYAEATEFIYTNNKISGVKWEDKLSGKQHEISAKYTISAADPWVDKLRKKNESLSGKHLHPTKGVHIVVTRERFPVGYAMYFDVPDGRMIFAVPRDRITYIGTTDTDYHGDLDNVRTEMIDVQYLLDGVNHTFPSVDLKVEDVESTWAGLRPFLEEEGNLASELSRKDGICESETGFLSIAGGKLNGYRKMSEHILDRVADKIKSEYDMEIKSCQTENSSAFKEVCLLVRRTSEGIREKTCND